jgi:hypothetical protein
MAELNHFAIAAGMGATLGPRVPVHHGQIGSAELAATLSGLLERRKQYVESLSAHDDVSRKYEKAVIQAYGLVRQGYSSDRVLADPQINAAYIKACRDLGLDDDTFHLNLALIGLRKHNKLKAKSLRSRVPDLWRYAVASEIAARAIFYQYGASVDTLLAHPKLAREFDALAGSITPGFSSFQYRWAALNVRKKGANVKLTPKELERLEWSGDLRFDVRSLPAEEGVYTLFERNTCLFVAGTEDIDQSIQSQKRIAEVPLFEPGLWRPDPAHLSWRYVSLPDTESDYRFGVVRAVVGRWSPVFNIPRGNRKQAA